MKFEIGSRFLVYLDNGEAAYVADGCLFHLFAEQKPMHQVWSECKSEEGRHFLKTFFHFWPDRVRLHESQTRCDSMLEIVKDNCS